MHTATICRRQRHPCCCWVCFPPWRALLDRLPPPPPPLVCCQMRRVSSKRHRTPLRGVRKKQRGDGRLGATRKILWARAHSKLLLPWYGVQKITPTLCTTCYLRTVYAALFVLNTAVDATLSSFTFPHGVVEKTPQWRPRRLPSPSRRRAPCTWSFSDDPALRIEHAGAVWFCFAVTGGDAEGWTKNRRCLCE